MGHHDGGFATTLFIFIGISPFGATGDPTGGRTSENTKGAATKNDPIRKNDLICVMILNFS
jgi:hypothetical protein